MRTVQELRSAAVREALYSPKSVFTPNGIRQIEDVLFFDVIRQLEQDEHVLFCLPYDGKSCIAFTSKKIIDVQKGGIVCNAPNIVTHSYDSVGDIETNGNCILIKYGNRYETYCPCNNSEAAVRRMNSAITAYKNKGSVTNNTISAADELRKFKELLDMGIITQAEFNIKKKQILGF